jgi:uracil-DNA glycosylase family 4
MEHADLIDIFVRRTLAALRAGQDRALTPDEELALIAAPIRRCRNCDLALNRTQAVPGEGDSRALIMFVGEAPGATEDETGRPFVGAAGKFLEEMLADIGLGRRDVFIANITKCRPPDNRDPEPDEIAACRPWLRAQIAATQPKVICTLGRFAMNTLIDPCLQISKAHASTSPSTTPPPPCTSKVCATRSSPICAKCATSSSPATFGYSLDPPAQIRYILPCEPP